MALTQLDEQERQVVLDCLRAAVDGPFFPEWEFHTLFGLTRQEVKQITNTWPEIDDSNEEAALAINNAMSNLLHYPHRQEEAWRTFISVTPREVERVFQKWRHSKS